MMTLSDDGVPGAEPNAGPPFVVFFFYEGIELRARVRNVQTQDQWIMRNASGLRDVLANIPIAKR